MKIHTRKPLGGWVADRDAQPDALSQTEAARAGFRPRPDGRAKEFVLVATSHQKGFKGRLAKTYYSVWGR